MKKVYKAHGHKVEKDRQGHALDPGQHILKEPLRRHQALSAVEEKHHDQRGCQSARAVKRKAAAEEAAQRDGGDCENGHRDQKFSGHHNTFSLIFPRSLIFPPAARG